MSLKNNKTYYLKSKNINDESLEKYISNEFIKFATKNFDSNDHKYIVVNTENHDGSGYGYMFLFFEESKSKQTIKFFNDLNVLETYKDVTEDIHTSNIFDNEDFKSVYNNDEFKHIFDTFIYKNLSTNDILDKIIKRGIDSLTNVDKKILEKEA